MVATEARGYVIARGYWCPVCGCAFHVHAADELAACADEAERRLTETDS